MSKGKEMTTLWHKPRFSSGVDCRGVITRSEFGDITLALDASYLTPRFRSRSCASYVRSKYGGLISRVMLLGHMLYYVVPPQSYMVIPKQCSIFPEAMHDWTRSSSAPTPQP